MRAEIFCLDEQESEIPFLTRLLRRHVYPATKVTVHKLAKYEKWNVIAEAADRYSKLLEAAIPRATKLRVYPKEHMSSGFMYIQVYYPWATEDWEYTRVADHFAGDFHLFFPAIALQGRMCIVSETLGGLLDRRSSGKTPFRSLDNAGVLRADFASDEAIAASIVEAAKQIRNEVTAELAAYASYEKGWNVDLTKVAADMKVDPGYLIHCLQTGAVQQAMASRLDCVLDKTSLEPNAWTKACLAVTNKSDMPIVGAEVVIAGPVKIRPSRLYVNIPANSTAEVSLAIMPLETGALPLEISFATAEDRPFSEWTPPHHIWIESGPANTKTLRPPDRPVRRKLKAAARTASLR